MIGNRDLTARLRPLARPVWLTENVWPFQTSTLTIEGSGIAITDVGQGHLRLCMPHFHAPPACGSELDSDSDHHGNSGADCRHCCRRSRTGQHPAVHPRGYYDHPRVTGMVVETSRRNRPVATA